MNCDRKECKHYNPTHINNCQSIVNVREECCMDTSNPDNTDVYIAKEYLPRHLKGEI